MTALAIFDGAGPMGEVYRQKDWSRCALGPPEAGGADLQAGRAEGQGGFLDLARGGCEYRFYRPDDERQADES